MKKWLVILGIVFLIEVVAEAAHLVFKYIFLSEISRTSIVAFIALLLSVSIIMYREA